MPLTLGKETKELHWKGRTGTQSAQILLEGDMIVPDAKPDLKEILRCEGRVKIREKRIGEERVSFSGEVEVTVLYRAKNGEMPLYGMKASLPMEDFLHMEGLQKGMDVQLKANLEHMECQTINDRKIGIKAVILVEAVAEEKKSAEVLTATSGENMETLTGFLRMEADTVEQKDRFTVKEEITLPASQPQIGEILLENIFLTEQEIRPMDEKALVRGNIVIQILYGDEEGKLGSLTEKIPFSGYLENPSITPKTNLTGKVSIEEYQLQPAVDEDGESRLLHVDVSIGVWLQGKEKMEQEILLDAYTPEGTVSMEKERITYPVTVAEGKNQFTIKERIHLEKGEVPMLRAETVLGKAVLSEKEALHDAVQAEGVLTAEILYHCADDSTPVAMLRRNIPFTQTMEGKGVRTGDETEVALALEEMDFQMLSETEGELRATVTMEGTAKRLETAEVGTGIVLEEEVECPSMPGAIIYMVQKGDSLWKIAKNYRTTISDILAINEIENPDLIYPGQKLLIIKRRR